MRRIRARIPDIVLVVLAICVSLGLAEGFVRLFYPHVRDHVVPGRLFEIDETLGWKLRPGANAVHTSRYFQAPYAINRFGHRDRDRAIAKGGATYRILLFGDSQAFGWGVPMEARYTNLVEARSAGLEVWNLAVPGYGLDQEILSYEQDGQRFEADEVVLLVSNLTLGRIPYDYVYRKNKPKFVLDPVGRLQLVPVRSGAIAWTSLLYRALSDLYLPYFVDYQLASASKSFLGTRADRGASSQTSQRELGRLEQAMLERVHAVARSRGHRLTLLVELPPSLDGIKLSLRRFCDEHAIGCLETAFPPPAAQYRLGAHDGHWNPSAHALAAEQLLAQLRARASR